MSSELGRNDPCHCGSGKKYKACHLGQDEATAREARSQAGEAAATTAPKHQRPGAQQPWKRSGQNARGFQKHSAPRKVGGS